MKKQTEKTFFTKKNEEKKHPNYEKMKDKKEQLRKNTTKFKQLNAMSKI